MKLIFENWRKHLKENSSQEGEYFLRFGDPREVKHSVIHDPRAGYERLSSDDWSSGRVHQKYEAGISAYPVLEYSEDKVVFRAPVGLDAFAGQARGFLFDRLLNQDIYVFKAEKLSKTGTDGEPLIIDNTIEDIQRIGHRNIYLGQIVWDGEKHTLRQYKNIFDLIRPFDITDKYDNSYEELDELTPEELETKFNRLRQVFTTDKQQEAINTSESYYVEDRPDYKDYLEKKQADNMPFSQEQIDDSTFIREFNQDIDSEELIWHMDRKDRIVTILESSGWEFQMDNELPKILKEGDVLFIPKYTYHRVIKGSGKLIVEIKEEIRKTGSKWCLYSKKKTKEGKKKKLGCYGTKGGAKKREKQVQYFKHKG